ncbi:tumor necrosis factor receptor superfamily member 21 [Polypterus senegalus]
MMAWFSMGAALLFVFICDISAHSRKASSEALLSVPSGKYRHTDENTGEELLCDKCPAGTYVSKHCTDEYLRECSPCPNGTYTKHENGIEQCHRCRRHCVKPMTEKSPCTALYDRECTCPANYFLQNNNCKLHSVCPNGWGVRKKGNSLEDVKCKPCPRGTFSDVPSSVLRCKTHTNCSAQGLVIAVLGTKESDNICSLSFAPSFTMEIFTRSSSTEENTGGSSTSFLQDSISDLSSGILASTPEPTIVSTMRESSNTANEAAFRSSTYGYLLTTEYQEITKSQSKVSLLEDRQRSSSVTNFRTTRRGSSKPSAHKRFDINEHLPWMIVLFLLLVLVVIVICSVKKSSRVLKKGPKQDPSSIVEKAINKTPHSPVQNKEKWIYLANGQGVDILRLVAMQIGSQWIDLYKSLINVSEREVSAFSNGYTSDQDRAYAALQHWTIRDSDANLAKLISSLRQHRRNDVVEKIRGVMEDDAQLDVKELMTSTNSNQSPAHRRLELLVPISERSPVDKSKGFFADESEPLLRCDSTSSNNSALSRTGSFITKEKKDTVLRQVRLDHCDLQPIFDDMLHILNPEELHVIEEIPQAEDKLDKLFEIAGVKSQDASQKLIDSVYSHLPDLL